MAWFADIVRSAVGIANDLTIDGGMQVSVSHRAFVSQDLLGEVTYAAPVTRTCLMTEIKHQFYTEDDRDVQGQHALFFPANVPIDHRDEITLPDGTVWPSLDISGFADAELGGRYFTKVKLGQDYIRLSHKG